MEIAALLIPVLTAAVRAGTPVLYATLGEIFAERSGVLNLGVEGMMLVGALMAFVVTHMTGIPWLGVLAALLAGGLVSLIHGLLSITLRANQVVSGLALTIFGTGLSGFLGKRYIGVPAESFRPFPLPVLNDLPVLGPVLFRQDILVYLTYLLIPLASWVLYRTRWGLNIRAVGEHPEAADAMGVNVEGVRYACVTLGGMLAGLGGAYLSTAYTAMWIENMTAGRGWIAVALVIFATWDPLRAMGGAYLFGGVNALQLHVQAMGSALPTYLLLMTPYLFTIVVLILATRETARKRLGAPAALSIPYTRSG
ncbi:MAG: ABC transporter permease [Armatimonadota bacterium]|nr:ABC transporter permease [Armatimonadota bacterium]MDR5701994.1 ABC transporter permease [Armatimonadota bacterium]